MFEGVCDDPLLDNGKAGHEILYILYLLLLSLIVWLSLLLLWFLGSIANAGGNDKGNSWLNLGSKAVTLLLEAGAVVDGLDSW